MLESLAEFFTKGLEAVLSFFPDSPFTYLNDMVVNSEMRHWFAYLNWFIPVNTFVAIMEGWLLCIAIYYIWQIVSRKLALIT